MSWRIDGDLRGELQLDRGQDYPLELTLIHNNCFWSVVDERSVRQNYFVSK